MSQEPVLTNQELHNSIPFNFYRRFNNEAGKKLVDTFIAEIYADEQRQRQRRSSAIAKVQCSVEAVLANLFAAHANRLDNTRFIAIGLNRNDYSNTGLAVDAVRKCLSYLQQRGMIKFAIGFQRFDTDGVGMFGRRTRVRATDALAELFDEADLGHKPTTVVELIRIKRRQTTATPPNDVETSRKLLHQFNELIASAEPALDDNAISRWRERKDDETEQDDENAQFGGDLYAATLYRVFNYDWDHGGRLYGGWWQTVPKSIRPYILMAGEPTEELDYKTLHPRLLFLRAGIELDFDPYSVPGLETADHRNLGKKTFNRLLNRKVMQGRSPTSIRGQRGDRAQLPKGYKFKDYLAQLLQPLDPIRQWFGSGEGLRLQREDSDLAIRVMTALANHGVAALPVHDSFIVQKRNRGILQAAMVESFREIYGVEPQIG